MNQTFTAVSERGELTFNDPQRLKHFLAMNPGEMTVSIAKKRKIRSDRQNRYWYGVVLDIISQDTGYTVREVKDFLKAEFGITKVITMGDKAKTVLRSSAELDTAEFEKFMSQIRMWAASHNIQVPEPNSPF